MKETPLCFGDVRVNKMNKLFVYSSSPYDSDKELLYISEKDLRSVKNTMFKKEIILVVVTPDKRKEMENLAKLIDVKYPIDFGKCKADSFDEEYLLKEKFIPSVKKKVLSALVCFSTRIVMA